MTEFNSYSSKSTALRGLTRHLGVAVERLGETDPTSLLEQVGEKWGFYPAKVDAKVFGEDASEEDENLVLCCGHSHCPECGIHLSNGLLDYDSLVDQHGEKEAFKLQKHEWSCMGCNAEWGKPIDAPTSKGRKEPTRHYINKSTVDGAVQVVWDLCNEMPDARRKDVIATAVEKGVAFYTARTQYQKWFTAKKTARTAK